MVRGAGVQGQPEPYGARLRAELADIATALDVVLDQSGIVNIDPNRNASTGVAFLGFARWGWEPSSPALTRDRMTARGKFDRWMERARLLFPTPTREVARALDTAEKLIGSWLDRPGRDKTVPSSVDAARQRITQELDALERLLDVAGADGDDALRLIPDTNALLANPDLASYAAVATSSRYELVLLPTVLRELDELKDRGRTPELRQKAQDVARRIKGLRDKGWLSEGVTLTRTMTVRIEARDVHPPDVLGWLSADNADDRILAGTLVLQSAHPASTVVLVTLDLGLQTKAETVGIPYIEPPTDPAAGRAKIIVSAGHRASKEHVHGAVAQLTVTNQGPGTATDVEVQAQASFGRGRVTSGPYTWPELAQGDSESRDLALISSGELTLSATWRDASGDRNQTWKAVLDPPRGHPGPPPARR